MPGKKVDEDKRRTQILRAAFQVAVRDRLDGLTIRNVASEAGISSGLVFFHFKTKDALLLELLIWLLRTTVVAEVGPDILAQPTPVKRLMALFRQEINRLETKRVQFELFFDYWVIGNRDPTIRQAIRQALDSYRATFYPLAEAVIAHDPQRFASTTPDGLATVVSSIIQGCALQTIKDPGHLDTEQMMVAIYALVGHPVSAPLV